VRHAWGFLCRLKVECEVRYDLTVCAMRLGGCGYNLQERVGRLHQLHDYRDQRLSKLMCVQCIRQV
jgi:hypothetical protein